MEGFDSQVADISLHEWGRKEIQLAEVEMPGISTLPELIFYRTYGLQN
jgi:S-adenosylhomocysteine hydrolase